MEAELSNINVSFILLQCFSYVAVICSSFFSIVIFTFTVTTSDIVILIHCNLQCGLW